MSKPREPSKGLIFYSIVIDGSLSHEDIREDISKDLGFSEDLFWPKFNPLFDYYSGEMGSDLKRFIFTVTELVEREKFLELKLKSLDWENHFSENSKRKVNIDTGLICLEQLSLATFKPYSHRIYLGKGIYSDLTYVFKNKRYEPLSWTYPDYVESEKISYFEQKRQVLKSLTFQ